MERSKRYQIIKRHEREAIEKRPQGINAVGIEDGISAEHLLIARTKHESPLPRSSQVDDQGVQMQQGRRDPSTSERQKRSSSLRNATKHK